MAHSRCPQGWATSCAAMRLSTFPRCVRGCFWGRLACELVDGVKQKPRPPGLAATFPSAEGHLSSPALRLGLTPPGSWVPGLWTQTGTAPQGLPGPPACRRHIVGLDSLWDTVSRSP